MKFSVELNSAPKQNMRFSSSLHRLAPEFQVWNTWYSIHKIVREGKRKKRATSVTTRKSKYKQWNIIHTYIKKKNKSKLIKKGKVSRLVLFFFFFFVYLVVRFFFKKNKNKMSLRKKFMSREIGIQEKQYTSEE